jgi:hypothetical protein
MNQKWKVITIALITALALTMSLAAQESNTFKATAGNFSTDVDNFFDLHSWGDVEFDKYFAFAGFRNNPDAFNGYELDAGYARRFGSIYLSAFYEGQITSRSPGQVTTTTDKISLYGLNGGIYELESEQTEVTNATTLPDFNNNIGVLIGVAGMGIKAGFYENMRGTDKYTSNPFSLSGSSNGTQSDITETSAGIKTVSTDITEYNYLEGTMLPYLGWGMNLDVANLVIKPKVEIGLGIVTREEKYSFFVSMAYLYRIDQKIPLVIKKGCPNSF